MIRRFILSLLLIEFACGAGIGGDYSDLVSRLLKAGMPEAGAYRMLTDLTRIGPRPTGSESAAAAVEWAKMKMEKLGLQNVRLEPVTVPHWIRGEIEQASANSGGRTVPLTVAALGGSPGTPEQGITAGVIEVQSLQEAQKLGDSVKGKIVFFNGSMDASLVNTFEAYGKAGEQRNKGPAAVAASGAVGALVRSLTQAIDDVPHTGGTRFDGNEPHIPAAALSTVAANELCDLLKKDPNLTVTLRLSAKYQPDVESANVVGEIVGSEKPNEIILISAHLDSWDKGTGAEDDGAGCAHVLEAAALIHKLDLKPKRTIRVVLFMNEEFGLSGGKAYAAMKRPAEKHIAALESDAGGFTPRGFSVESSPSVMQKVGKQIKVLEPLGISTLWKGHSGSDISELVKQGTPGIGFVPDGQRYFDFHHSDKDTLEVVHPRELELGAISIAALSYMIAEDGL